jgi:hypothetical protein
MIELSQLFTHPNDPKIMFKNVSGLSKPVFKEPNILDKNNQPPSEKENSKEPFTEGLTNYTCKRKGTTETAVINNTIMGPILAEKLIQSQTYITISVVIMVFVSILVISITYLTAILPDAPEMTQGSPIPGGGQLGGMGELCSHSDQKILNGYIFIIGLSLIVLNLYGALYLKVMNAFYLAILFVVITGVYYVKYIYKEMTIYDVELEHIILYNREKPVVKWLTMSAHYIWFSVVSALALNKELSVASFSTLQWLYGFFVTASYLLYRNYDMIFTRQTTVSSNVSPTNISMFEKIINMFTSVIFGVPTIMQSVPIVILILIAVLTSLILSYKGDKELPGMSMNIDNIKLEAPKGVNIEAPKGVNIEAPKGINVK